MRKLIRLLVVWLLALVLPIQGVAAATMRHCGSERGPASAIAGLQSMGGESHSPIAMLAGTAVHEHHGAHAHSNLAAAEPAHHHASHAKVSCSACASCCGAVALLTSSVMPMAASVGRSAAVALPTALVVAFLTDGPDRPPRSMLG
jgi:hypothetical protein